MFNSEGNIDIEDSIFKENVSKVNGGAIYS